ncbi:glycosyltransferase family 4 protein [Ideonella margarita]|uniref:Glycosyltransferase family 1 protein n=1 Tax=Ideonella margarita TaxID=2984191 RepID=A0ABU9C443_9BURK
MTPLPSSDLVIDDFPAQGRWLRISMVTETYPPEVNGVARTVASVVDGLRARGHELQLIRPNQHRGDEASSDGRFHEVLMRGLPIPRYPQLRLGVATRQSFLRIWSRRRPDVVHIATEGPMGWAALQAARQLRIPVCSDFRTNFHAYSQHYGIGWLHKPIMAYLRKFHNQTGCTTTPDAGLRQTLTDLGMRNVIVVARGVDSQLFNPQRRSPELRAEWGVGPQDIAVVHVGRMAPEKNLDALVVAFEAIERAQPSARLVLVGDGPSSRELQRRLPRAIFAGMRHGTDLAAHYASGDLFLFPSLSETYGNVTAEALASGLPVAAFNYAAAGQLVRNGVNGAVVPMADTPAFVHAASQLTSDVNALRQMGQAARQGAEQLGWDRIIDQIEGVYHKLIAGRAVEEAAQPAFTAGTLAVD